MSQIYHLNQDNINDLAIKTAKYINDGAVVLIPTDTVYGLSCNYMDRQARKRISEIKKRPLEKSYIVLINSKQELLKISDQQIPDAILHCLPASLTIIIRNRYKDMYQEETIAVRYPNNQFLNRAMDLIQLPIISTSANISGEEMPQTNEQIISCFDKQVDLIVLDKIKKSKASTLLDISKMPYEILRQGSFIPDSSWFR